MKKRLFSILLALCMVLTMLPTMSEAADSLPKGLKYSINGDTVTITDYFGSATELVIPATIEGKNVTKIGDQAFKGCDWLTSITIPDSVTKIDEYAFCNCDGLTSITIPDGVTTIGDFTFYDCASLTSVTIGDSVTKIGDYAFCDCDGLTSITIGDSVTKIGDSAFKDCTSLTSVTIPDSVTTIGGHAFSDCDSLTSITIPASVTTIDNYAFIRCTGLTSVTIGDSVTTIGYSAFYGCDGLTSVTFTGNLPTIDRTCFATTSTTAYYPCNNDTWTDAAVQKLAGTHTSVTWKVKHNYVNGICTECGETPFADIPADSWQLQFAQYAVENGLMAGKGTDAYGNIKFDPNSPITREEFVQVLYNAEGKPAISIANPFPDVADGGWYKNAVLWAKQNDIASGKGNGNFGVGENISRQDLAMMLYKYAKLNGYSLDATDGLINQFADGANVASYAKTAMDWAVTNGIMSGKGAAGAPLSSFRLDPTGIATRAECAAMLKNFQTAFGG